MASPDPDLASRLFEAATADAETTPSTGLRDRLFRAVTEEAPAKPALRDRLFEASTADADPRSTNPRSNRVDGLRPVKPRKRMSDTEQAMYDERVRPERGAARQMLIKSLEETGYLPSVTSALSGPGFASNQIRRDGEYWITPQVARTAPKRSGKAAKVAAGLGSFIQAVDAQFGAESAELTPIIERVRRTHNLSDEDIADVWQDLRRTYTKWDKDEPTRVLSDGTITLNPSSRDILDPEKVADLVESAQTSRAAKEHFMRQYDSMRQNIASNRLAAYEAAAPLQKGGVGVLIGPGLKKTHLLAPSEWAKQQGRLADINTPDFIQDYERDVLDKQGKAGAYVRSLGADAVLGWNKLAVSGLGMAGFMGSETAGKMAAEGQEAQDVAMQGKADTGITGAVVRELPSVGAQMVLAPATGGATMALTGSAKAASIAARLTPILASGMQSSGSEYASAISQGLSEEEARDRALIAGVNTTLITGMFSLANAGAVEDVAAGKSVAAVTLRDIFKAGSKQEIWANTRNLVKEVAKDYAAEFTEEGFDTLTGSFLNADPDTSLAEVWADTWESAKVGGIMGAGVKIGQAAVSPSQAAADTLLTPEVGKVAPASAEAARATAPADLAAAATAEPTVDEKRDEEEILPETAPEGETAAEPIPAEPLTETPTTDGLEPSTQPDVASEAPAVAETPVGEDASQAEVVGRAEEVAPSRAERPDEKIRRRVLDKMRLGQELTEDEQAAADAELKWAAETQQLPADSPELQDPETFKTWKSARNNINDTGFVAADQGSLDRTVELHRALTLKGDTETADRMLERAKTTARKETDPAKIKQESEKKGDPLTDSEAAEIAATNAAFNQRVNAAIAAMEHVPSDTAPAAEETAPTLSREGLKDAFDLTDEQAEVAESMARALGLSPERVLLARERGVTADQVTPEMVAERVAAPKAETAEPKSTVAEAAAPVDVQTKAPDAQQTTLSDTDAGQSTAAETPTTQPRNRTGIKALDTLNSDERITEITKDKKSGLITAKMADGTEVKRKSAVALKKTLGEVGPVTESTTSPEPVKETPSDVTNETERTQTTDENQNNYRPSADSRNLLESAQSLPEGGRGFHFGSTKRAEIIDTRAAQIAALSNDSAASVPDQAPVHTGGEHRVWVSADGSTVIKQTLPGYYGRTVDESSLLDPGSFQNRPQLTLRAALPSEYLTRWAVLSEVFGTPTTYVGKTGDTNPQMVVTQPFIAQTDLVTADDVAVLMTAHGFTPVTEGLDAVPELSGVTWYRQSDGILIADTHPRNFRKDAVTGVIIPTDLMVSVVPKGASQVLPDPNAPWSPSEDTTERYQGAKGSAQLKGEQVILKGLKNPDFTTAVHEMMHGFEMTEYGDLTDAEVATLKSWAGSKTDGRTMMERKASEKLARGWERYLAEGKAPVARLQALFDKIASWMLSTYKTLGAADLKVKISPEVRAIFDKIAARMENPSFIQTPSGMTMETADGSPLPPVVTELPENPTDDQVVGYIRGLTEKETPDLSSEEWNPDGAISLQERRSYEEAKEYKLDTTGWTEAARTFKDLWEQAVNRPKGYGAALLEKLIGENNPDRVLEDSEIASLTHEGLVRKVAVDEANTAVAEAIKTGKDSAISKAMAALKGALAEYQLLQDFAAASRRASGRSLNAWKYALRNDFSVATLQTRHAQDLAAMGAGEMTEADRRAIDKYSAEQTALQAELRALETASESERAGLEERLAQAEAQIAALEAEVKNSRKRTVVQSVAKKLVVDKVRKAAAEARARLKSANAIKVDPNERFQSPTPENDPHWYDRVIVLSEVLIADPAMSLAQFTDRVRNMFGDAYAAAADFLFKDSHRQLKNAYADITGATVQTPEEIMEGVGEDTEVTRELITELAKAHISDGAKGFQVLNRVHQSLKESFPDLTRDDVAQIFTRYGEQKPLSKSEEATLLRDARALELVLKQIQDLESKGEMKKTGRTKDEPSAELRELRKKRDDLAKKVGYNPVDPETQMSSAQSAAKKRMRNEIEELQGAIDSGNPRVRVRRGVEYTGEMTELKEKLDGLRKTYEETFGKERTPDEINARLLKDLDRRIAKEQDLIERGLLREPENIRPLVAESEDVVARRAYLADLRQQKRDAYERAHPGETALKQAMDAAQKAVERRQAILDAGVPEVAGRGKRGDGVTPTTELQDLWNAADAMDDLIREIRRSRPETPARQQARLDAAYDAAIRSREDLLNRITRGDLATRPVAPKTVDARLRAIREENAGLRKTLNQMRKDAGWGPFSQEAREARSEANLEKRLTEILRKRSEKDYSTKPREEAPSNARIRQLQQEIDINRVHYEQERAKALFEKLPMGTKAREKAMALWMARQMLNLTGDFGIFGRQLGKVRYRIIGKDALAAGKRLLKGEKLSLKEKALSVQVLSQGIKTLMDPEVGDRIYHDIVTDPRYLFRKRNGFRAVKPHETSHELTSEGRVRLNPLEVLNNRTIALVMLGKGLVKTAVGLKLAAINPLAAMAAWPTIRNGVAEALGSTAVAILGVKFARRVEAAQTAMVNLARWGMLDYVDVAAQNVDPRVRDEFYKNATSIDMIMSGKLAGKGTKWLADNAYVLGLGVAFPQYNITNLMATAGAPLWMRASDAKGTKGASFKYAAASYAYWLGGAAAMRLILSAILGVWDEDDDEVTHGVVMNPKHPKFGQIRLGNTFINPDGGALKWWYAYQRIATTVKLDPKALKAGVEMETERTAWDRDKALKDFAVNQLNMNVQTILQYKLIKKNRDGVDLTKVSNLDYTDMLLDDVVMNLALQQAFEVYEEHGLEDAVKLWTLLMTGTDVNIQEFDEDYRMRKFENKLKETE